MKKKLTVHYNMIIAVLALCDKNPAIVALIVAFKNAKDNLAATVAAIEAALAEKVQLTTGISASKAMQKESLCKLAHSVASALFAWASFTNNQEIIAQSKFSYSDLMKLRDDEVATVCLNIQKLAEANMADLNNYGLTNTINNLLLTATNSYKTAAPKPRNAVAARKVINATLESLINEGRNILKTQMDPTSVLLAASNPAFVKKYKANRKLSNLPTIHTQIKGEMTSEQTQAPIEHGELCIVELNQKIFTDDKGQLVSGKVPNGKYTLRATAANFAAKELTNVEVKRGEITRLGIVLEPAA